MSKRITASFGSLLALISFVSAAAAPSIDSFDPLVAVDRNRASIIADIVKSARGELNKVSPGHEADELVRLRERLSKLRADRLLAASLTSSYASLETVMLDSESLRDSATHFLKALGDPTRDLVYTPLTPCRLIDTRGYGAPITGGAFAPNARRAYSPNGLCGLPTSGVVSLMVALTTENLTPGSGGYLAVLSPGAPVATTADVFNLGSEWSATNSVVPTGPAAQFDVLVSTANAHVVVDILGYFAPPQGGSVTSITAATGLTGGTITSTGTIALATPYQLPQTCTNGQVPTSNGTGGWTCTSAAGGSVTSVATGTGLNGGPITSTGTINLATTQLLPTVACATNQIPKWSGTVWICAADSNSGGTITGITAGTGLTGGTITSSGTIGLGTVAVANGGTGQTTLAANGIVYGQGTSAVGTAIGVAGDIFTGTAGAPAWTGSPSISGNLTLVNPSTAGGGNIMKGGNRFIHNFGSSNTFIGENAGNFTMTGSQNTADGVLAFSNNTTGNSNTASGAAALYSNTTGTSNTANGVQALFNNTGGSSNTGSGLGVLFSNTTGFNNTASGVSALNSNTGGFGNTASGVNTLYYNAIGSNNTAFGMQALQNSTGSNNVALGIQAGFNLTSGSSNIAIGNQGVAAEANAIRIGVQGTQTATFIAGIAGTTITGGVAVFANASGQLGTATSSRRYKDDIADMDAASGLLMNLRPVTFHYKADKNPQGRTLQYGLIAEEVAEVYPGLIAHSADGQIETVMYQYLPPMLLNEYQKQHRMIDIQSRELAKQQQVVAELKQDRVLLRQALVEIAELKLQTAHLARLLDQRRNGSVTAGLKLK